MGELISFPSRQNAATPKRQIPTPAAGLERLPEETQNEAERRRNPLWYDKVTGEYLDEGMVEMSIMAAFGVHNPKLHPQIIAAITTIREQIREQLQGLRMNFQ